MPSQTVATFFWVKFHSTSKSARIQQLLLFAKNVNPLSTFGYVYRSWDRHPNAQGSVPRVSDWSPDAKGSRQNFHFSADKWREGREKFVLALTNDGTAEWVFVSMLTNGGRK